MNINGVQVKCAEINFLCVHKSLRARRLAPVLIKEITRRVNLHDIWQAVYTAGVTIPTPFTGATYWHRSLNVQKLVDVRFSAPPVGVSMSKHIKNHKLPNKTFMSGWREMTEDDVPQVHVKLNEYLATHKVHIEFSEEEVRHFLLPRENVVHSFVVEADGGEVTDFFSFYVLPSSILKHE